MGRVAEDTVHRRKNLNSVTQLCEEGIRTLPPEYVLPIADRSSSGAAGARDGRQGLKLPIVDLAQLLSPTDRPRALRSLASACEEYGFFQIVNHGIPERVATSMIDVGRRFFHQPLEERVRHMSVDVRSPVRFGTSFNQLSDSVLYWRDFLKLSCHPLPVVLPHWPSSPTDLREVAISYAKQSRILFESLVGAVLETLGLVDTGGILEDFKEGTQVMVVNFYPSCPEPDLTFGMPPHSDYGFLTLVLQDGVKGLQIDHRGKWVTVDPEVPNSIVVNVGDHLEIFSNGRYKSVLHRVLVNSSEPRISVACLHSLPFAHVVSPSPDLVSEENPKLYMDTDFTTFLDYISHKQPEHKSFLKSRKIKNNATARSTLDFN